MNKSIWAVSMFKDEADVAFNSVLHLAEEGVSGIIVADNLSTDNTYEQLLNVQSLVKGSCKVIIVKDEEVGYYQSRKMTQLAHKAHEEYGAEWIIPFDADELWVSHTDNIKNTINDLPEDIDVIFADLYNHFPSAIDGNTGNPFEDIGWRQQSKGALPKVVCKWHKDMVIEQGNHGVTYPFIPKTIVGLEIRHFPYRSWEQFKRKAINGAAAYKATTLKGFGDHWLSYNSLIEKWGDDVVRKEVFETYFWFYSPIDNGMIYDPAPFRRWNK